MIATRSLRRDPVPTALIVVSAAAWVALGVWSVSPAGRDLNHTVLEHAIAWPEVAALAVGWMLMVFAMMVPMLVPLVRWAAFGRAGLVSGYVLVWAAFGLAAHLGDRDLHLTVDAHPWLQQHPWTVLAGTVALAGSWELCELKQRCVVRCRAAAASPVGGFRAGLDYGRYCAGACWALMLLVFALGMGNIGWMALFSAVTVAQRAGYRLSAALGPALLATAAGVVAYGVAFR